MKRGDVYQANLDPVIGSEQGGIRPVVIIQNDRGNRYSPTVIVVAVTTRRKKPQLPVHVLLTREESGLKEDSIVLTELPVISYYNSKYLFPATISLQHFQKIFF